MEYFKTKTNFFRNNKRYIGHQSVSFFIFKIKTFTKKSTRRQISGKRVLSICFIFNNLHRRFVSKFHNTINREHEEISMFIHVPANYMYTPSCHHHQPPPPSGRPNLPNQTGYTIPSWITHHQDNPVTRITQSPNRPHIDNPISPSPSESSKITTPKCMCAVSTSQYRFQFTVSIPTWCPPYHIGVSHI